MDNRTSGKRNNGKDKSRNRRRLRICLYLLLVAAVATAEYFAVAAVYGNMAYNEVMRLWDCGGSIEANRRTPDPIYHEPVLPDVPDTLFDDFPEEEDIIDIGGNDAGAGENAADSVPQD